MRRPALGETLPIRTTLGANDQLWDDTFGPHPFPGWPCAGYLPNQRLCSPSSQRWKSSDMSSSGSFTGDGWAQRVFASQAIWRALFAGSISAGRCVVTLFLCPALITAAAFITLYTSLWWR